VQIKITDVVYEMANCLKQINTSCRSEDESACSSLGSQAGMAVFSETMNKSTVSTIQRNVDICLGESGSEEECYTVGVRKGESGKMGMSFSSYIILQRRPQRTL